MNGRYRLTSAQTLAAVCRAKNVQHAGSVQNFRYVYMVSSADGRKGELPYWPELFPDVS
jgi:hypothetical protein